MQTITIPIKRIHDDAVVPTFATELAAGFDLYAVEDVLVRPNCTACVPLGFAVAIPEGYEMQIRPRSGVSLKTPLRVANSPATIDADYRGEVKVLLENVSQEFAQMHPQVREIHNDFVTYLDGTTDRWYGGECRRHMYGTYVIRKGDRIAQGVIAEVPRVRFELVDTLDETARGEGGFGHTGTN